ncbi:MAG: TetR/AcrR family transcriptional regulator [Ignavibacteriaceae bacterium]|jgi:AcrR family transcriptional regulator
MNLETPKYRELIPGYVLGKMINAGYQKITLEEITVDLAISKKTIYKEFSTKEELLNFVFLSELTKAYQKLVVLVQEKSPMFDKVEKLADLVASYIILFSEESLQKLKKEFPGIWKKIVSFRMSKILPLINHIINHSKKHKIINNISNELVINLFSNSLTAATDKSFLIHNNLTQESVFKTIFNILLNGMLTQKGKKLLTINQRIKK